MRPIILKANNFDDMEQIAESFIKKGFKIISSEPKYVLVKKRTYGKWYAHALFLFLILFVISYDSLLLYLACGLYIVYFSFYLFTKSKIVLITTDDYDEDGNPVKFDDIQRIDSYF